MLVIWCDLHHCMVCWRSYMFYYHLLLCVYAIPSFNLQKNDSKSHFGLHLCLYPVLIIVVSLLPYTVMATPQVMSAAVAYFTEHKGEFGVSYTEKSPLSLVLEKVRTDQRSCFSRCKTRAPLQDHHRVNNRIGKWCATRHARQRCVDSRSCSQAMVICFFESASV